MGQFRFLVPLLLVHDHWNYQRMGYMISYKFYRNATLIFVLYWYALFTAFTLTTALTDWSSMLYSIVVNGTENSMKIEKCELSFSTSVVTEYAYLQGNYKV